MRLFRSQVRAKAKEKADARKATRDAAKAAKIAAAEHARREEIARADRDHDTAQQTSWIRPGAHAIWRDSGGSPLLATVEAVGRDPFTGLVAAVRIRTGRSTQVVPPESLIPRPGGSIRHMTAPVNFGRSPDTPAERADIPAWFRTGAIVRLTRSIDYPEAVGCTAVIIERRRQGFCTVELQHTAWNRARRAAVADTPHEFPSLFTSHFTDLEPSRGGDSRPAPRIAAPRRAGRATFNVCMNEAELRAVRNAYPSLSDSEIMQRMLEEVAREVGEPLPLPAHPQRATPDDPSDDDPWEDLNNEPW